MKVNELMVGDFIYQHHPKDNTPHIVKVSVDTLNLMDRMKIGFIQEQSPLYRIIEPIPLTTEILEKNGFKKYDGNKWLAYKYEDDDYTKKSLYQVLWSTDDLYLEISSYTPNTGNFNRIGIRYVHELQHALKLCGIEKNIII